MGDCSQWDGVLAKKSNPKAAGKGLAGSLYDFQVIQEKLYARPSGKWLGLPFTNHLSSMLLVDDNSVINREIVLKQLRKVIATAVPAEGGWYSIHIYYTGHGSLGGHWLFANGEMVTL